MKFNVYGVSSWPESVGDQFEIFTNKTFESEQAAEQAAKAAYYADLEVIVKKVVD